jgi:hypothetical protein
VKGRLSSHLRSPPPWAFSAPLLRRRVAKLRSNAVVLDGEAVYCDRDGGANFEKLHSQVHNDGAEGECGRHWRGEGSGRAWDNIYF